MCGSPVGLPSSGTRAWRCRTAAPAIAASIDCSAICSGVMGSASDIVGVWAEPVTAQVIITFPISVTLLDARQDLGEHLLAQRAAGQRHADIVAKAHCCLQVL